MMLKYIAPNLTVDLNPDVNYPLMRVGAEGYFTRITQGGEAAPVNFLLWADGMDDAKGGFVICLHLWRPDKHEDRVVHVLGSGGDGRFQTLEQAVERCAKVAEELLFKDVTSVRLVSMMRDRVMMIVVTPPPSDPKVDVPGGTNFH